MATGEDTQGRGDASRKIGTDPRFARLGMLAFGIGAQKAGTTWLHRYFRAHPDISTPALKETTYWNYVETGKPHPWTRERADRFGAGRGIVPTFLRRVGSPFPSLRPDEMMLQARMLDAAPETHAHYADLLLNGYRGETTIAEISPTYALLRPETFAAMATLAPQVRFFYVMRDPVARALSGLRMTVDRGWLRHRGITTFDAALEDTLSHPGESFALDASRYDLAIARLEEAVVRSSVHYMFYETLFDQESIDGLTDFLGVGRRLAPTDSHVLRGRKARGGANADQIAALRVLLAPVYDFVSDRFGPMSAPGWKF